MLIGVSFIPFIFSSEHYKGMNLSVKDYVKNYQLKDFLTFVFKGYNSIGVKMVWPAYLAVIIGGSINIGGAGSLMALGSAATSIAIGKITTSANQLKIISTGMALAAISYIGMAFVTTPVTAFAVAIMNGIGYTAGNVPIYSKTVNHAEQDDLIEYFAVREFAMGLGRVIAVLVTIAAFSIWEGDLRFLAAFSTLAISVLGTGYIGSRM